MPNDDSFTLVKGRKGKRRQSSIKFKTNDKQLNIVEYDLGIETLISQVRDAVLEFKRSPYKTVLLDGLSDCLDRLQVRKLDQIICYGLGNFSYLKNAKHQLASLIVLQSYYKCPVLIYDPLFNRSEIEALKLLKFKVITKNEEGKRDIENKVTLLFIIHCSKQLLNNFLYANWNEGIKNCIILGNSFSDTFSHSVNRYLEGSVNYLTKIFPYSKEITLKNNFEHFGTFSSTSMHIFPQEKLSCLNSEFWCLREEPDYQEKDVEFVRTKTTDQNDEPDSTVDSVPCSGTATCNMRAEDEGQQDGSLHHGASKIP